MQKKKKNIMQVTNWYLIEIDKEKTYLLIISQQERR